ncbi:hypothetical protein K431DRAFT_225773 [Polychaeton citri CBS 116435]|uniref:Integral membrane protein n=1 Tax=Polychaeton citri CBS 116435 TaxID=1314669 RepID=A0A9P4Q9D4_9PEZI|nr:hypothetical protein K431DRAFT_225773 [Polychaeton citri CBS 116435]
MFGRKKRDQVDSNDDDFVHDADNSNPADNRQSSDDTLTNNSRPNSAAYAHPTKQQIKRATRTRFIWSLIASFFLVISLVFLILVEIGNTRTNNKTLNNIYFININVSDIVPVSVPNFNLINSIAQTLGLHDFYQVGLWNFCEGYNDQGVTRCGPTQTLYWFNPVEIIKSELFAGATIALPQQINEILDLIRVVSHWMFGLFLTGACLTFVLIFLQPLTVFTRWGTLPIMIFTFLAALFTTVATIIATVMFIIMENAVTAATQLNIRAQIGIQMFAYMWIAAATAIIAWIIQLCLLCCCASRRDIKRGKKRGSKKAWEGSAGVAGSDGNGRQGWFRSKR